MDAGRWEYCKRFFTALDGYELNESLVLDFLDPVIAPNDFITVGNLVGPDGDLDADGYSNICEYRHFKKNLCSPSFPNPGPHVDASIDFVTAALDPEIVPLGCFQAEEPGDDCTISLDGGAVVPPNDTEDSGQARFRKFENTSIGAVRYQVNLSPTLGIGVSSARIMAGAPGESGETVIRDIPNASQTYWETYLTIPQGEAIMADPAYIEVTRTPYIDDPTQVIRGDNLGQCGPVVEEGAVDGEGTIEGEGTADGEGVVEGEGVSEGEGIVDGEGVNEGEGEVDGEEVTEGEGIVDGEGTPDGEGVLEGQVEGVVEGILEGDTDGENPVEGEGAPEGLVEGSLEGGVEEGEGEPLFTHSADEDGDGALSLGELLGIIQFYNFGSYQCDGNGGYTVGTDTDGCTPHSSDFVPDFFISMSELLRSIQVFNVGHYYACESGGAEDGYCLGQP